MTVSFPSTLHLHPILDVLLSQIPKSCHPEVRLGLQEALVNAAKHGNNLDPSKSIYIRFRPLFRGYCWIISDQGQGFRPNRDGADPNTYCNTNNSDNASEASALEDHERDCGRGLYILHHIFDQVEWSADGKELMLYKRTHRWIFPSLFWNS
ncbi:MAG: ATP-binding protein [Prochlorotrichaceae cyanobacterium]|jgi:anti-sigma regulatory factor (Ser/Thr protein kinase)